MNTFKKIQRGLALAAVLSVLGACSSEQPAASSSPAVVATNPAPAEVPAPVAPEMPASPVAPSLALPSSWPSDMPVPTGLNLLHVINSPTTANGTIAIYYGVADKAAVFTQMTAALEAAGYKRISATDRGPSISISTWTKGTNRIALNINTAAGNVTCSISVNPVG